MKKTFIHPIWLLVLAMIFGIVPAHAVTLNLTQMIRYAEANHPAILSLNQNIEALTFQKMELDATYDPALQAEISRARARQAPSYAAEPESADMFKSKLALSKGFDFGLKAEFYASYEETRYDYSDFIYQGNAIIPSGNLKDINGLLPPGVGNFKYGVNLIYPVFYNGGGLQERIKIETLNNQIAQARLQLQQQLRDLHLKIHQAYYAFELAQGMKTAVMETLQRNDQYLKIARQKNKDGYSPEMESLQAQVSLLATQEDQINASQAVLDARSYLVNAIGFNETAENELEVALEEGMSTRVVDYENFKDKVFSGDLSGQGITLNVLNAFKKVQAAQNALEQQMELKVSWYYNGKDPDPTNVFQRTFSFAYPFLFVGLTTDIFGDSNQDKARLKQAQSEQKIAEYQQKEYQQNLQQLMQNSYHRYLSAQNVLNVSQQKMDQFKLLMEKIKDQFYKGRIDFFNVVQTENLFQMAQMSYLQNKVKFRLAACTLSYLMGEI